MILTRRDGQRLLFSETRLERTGLSYARFEEAWYKLPANLLTFGKPIRATVAMGRPVGFTAVVKAPLALPTRPATFARRKWSVHEYPSRIIKLDGPTPKSQYVTIVGEWKTDLEGWELRSAYVGPFVFPQPWDFVAISRNEFSLRRVLDYWCQVAFLWQGRDFESRVQPTNWASLIDAAAKTARSETLTRIGYEQVRKQWHVRSQEVSS
jgi:hypothetical protein